MSKTLGFVLISIFTFLDNCFGLNETTCNDMAKIDRNISCIMIYEGFPTFRQRNSKPYGITLDTHEKCECENPTGSWWNELDTYAPGDTIIKRKGELVFYIHKKDTVLAYPYICDGKVYR